MFNIIRTTFVLHLINNFVLYNRFSSHASLLPAHNLLPTPMAQLPQPRPQRSPPLKQLILPPRDFHGEHMELMVWDI